MLVLLIIGGQWFPSPKGTSHTLRRREAPENRLEESRTGQDLCCLRREGYNVPRHTAEIVRPRGLSEGPEVPLATPGEGDRADELASRVAEASAPPMTRPRHGQYASPACTRTSSCPPGCPCGGSGRPRSVRGIAGRIRCGKNAPPWSPGRGGGPCQPPPPPAVAASRSTLAQDAGRRGAACRSRMRRRRRHPSTPRSTQPPPTPTGTGVTVPAFDRGRFAAVIPLPGAGCVTVADGVLWVLDASGTVARIDPETNRVAGRSVRIGASPQSLAVGGGSLWVANHEAGTVTRIEQASGKTVADIPVPSEPHRSPTARVRSGWATGTASPSPGSTQRRTVSSGRRSRSGSAPATWWSALAASGSPATTAWTPPPEDVVVVRIDPQTNRAVETIASVVTRSMSRQPRAPSGCRSQTPARCYGLPGANAASRPAFVSLSGSHDELGGTGGPLGVGGLQARKARSPSTRPGLRAERLAAKNAAAPVNQSREAHHSARPLHSPEEAIWRATRHCRSAPSVAPAGCGVRRYPTRLVEPRLSAFA
jgi:hypothetical protein